MSGHWELDGTKLRSLSDNTSITCTALNYNRRHRQSLTDIHNAGQDRQGAGVDLPTHNITFSIIGSDETKYSELNSILKVIDTSNSDFSLRDDTWTLQAPTGLDLYLWREQKRVAFTTQSYRVNIVSKAKVELVIDAIMQGVHIVDGGDFCEKLTGSFELTSTGPSVYTLSNGTGLEDQDGDATGTTPLITIPEQTGGYPLAVRASDYALVQPTLDSTSTTSIDGNTVTLETYDLTGFLVPAPSVAGDVGLFEVCSAPTDNYLSGGEGLIAPGSTLEVVDFALAGNGVLVYQGASTLEVVNFSPLTAAAALIATGASTLEVVDFNLVGEGLATVALTTETGDPLTTEAGDTLVTDG